MYDPSIRPLIQEDFHLYKGHPLFKRPEDLAYYAEKFTAHLKEHQQHLDQHIWPKEEYVRRLKVYKDGVYTRHLKCCNFLSFILQNFAEADKKIEDHNAQNPPPSFTMGHNEYSSLSEEEMRRMRGFKKPS